MALGRAYRHWPARGVVLLLSLALWALAAPASRSRAISPAASRTPVATRADCGGVEEVYPARHPRGKLPPLAIGDSTMLLSLDELAGIGYDANAHGCRQYPEALALLRQRKAEGRLPHMVVIALGGDGMVSHADVGEAIGLLCCTHLLVEVTNRELGGGSGQDAVTEREEAARHPGRIKLLDWVAFAQGHGDWFQPDGLHLTDVGARAFTDFLGRAMRWAYPPRRHRRRR